LARQHNDANVVSLGQRVVSLEAAKDLVAVFLTTEFEGGRHVRRIEKIAEHDCSP
jgi:ribose 5-phosphate isomerase B